MATVCRSSVGWLVGWLVGWFRSRFVVGSTSLTRCLERDIVISAIITIIIITIRFISCAKTMPQWDIPYPSSIHCNTVSICFHPHETGDFSRATYVHQPSLLGHISIPNTVKSMVKSIRLETLHVGLISHQHLPMEMLLFSFRPRFPVSAGCFFAGDSFRKLDLKLGKLLFEFDSGFSASVSCLRTDERGFLHVLK